MRILSLAIACLLGCATWLLAAGQPNILWITSEDNGAEWLACYGNPQAQTPRLDALAQSGVRFTHAYSNAPVCAVARSTILNGAYAPTLGTQHMRSRHRIPAIYQPYVRYLRQAGYYCTNNSKTDYNALGDDAAIWDECSSKAHYRQRPDGAPFFAVFNLMVSHESSLFAAGKAKPYYGTSPKTPRLPPHEVQVPPYLPDLPEIRKDIAIYHDMITRLDGQVGKLLDQLKADGLAENTIVFYYSDHGGVLPRGKRYLHDTGVRVPLIIHIPEPWASLSPFRNGSTCDENVSFVDFAPTLLSLIGIDPPPQMQGRAFLGTKRREPGPDNLVYLYADRFDELYGMRRGVTDGRWKYIRHFHPNQAAAPRSFYQFGQAGWVAWREAWRQNKLPPQHAALWNQPQPAEELFDTQSDPWEIHNLAKDPDPKLKALLLVMRNRLRQLMIDTADTGLVPEPMFHLAGDQAIAEYLATRKNELPQLVDLALAASSATQESLPQFQRLLASPDPLTRYWATQGCLQLGPAATPAQQDLINRLTDPEATIRITAAETLHLTGHPSGKSHLLAELQTTVGGYSKLFAINALRRIHAIQDIPQATLDKLSQAKDPEGYIKRSLDRAKAGD